MIVAGIIAPGVQKKLARKVRGKVNSFGKKALAREKRAASKMKKGLF